MQQSHWELDLFPEYPPSHPDNRPNVPPQILRIKTFQGYRRVIHGTSANNSNIITQTPKHEATSSSESPSANFLVLNDLGLGFNSNHSNSTTDITSDPNSTNTVSRLNWEDIIARLDLSSLHDNFYPRLFLVTGGVLNDIANDHPSNMWTFLVNSQYKDIALAVIGANRLRKQGARIGQGVSWERTFQDCITVFTSYPAFEVYGNSVI